jgi:ketosteroid isomerase-like protein
MNHAALIISSILSLLILKSGPVLAVTNGDFVCDFEQADRMTGRVPSPARGGCTEEQAVDRFRQFLSHLDEKTAREETEKVYAPDAYLNDTLKTVRGAPAIRDYFVKTARGLDSMSVQFDDLAVSGGNYYFRWTMETRMKNLARGKTVRTIGVTLVRFDREGRVIMHQDFWDSAQGVWEHVPVIGAVIRRIRAGL